MKIALVGNQNSGKTTLFNMLTGSNQKVGNWPGVTVEHKSGIIHGTKYEIIDLPGIYSLSPYTLEEQISRDFIFDESPDLIINIIDATSLERSLYLTTQLLELDTEMIVVMNMADILEKENHKLDIKRLSKKLGVDVLKISALKNSGIDKLIDKIAKQNYQKNQAPNIYSEVIDQQICFLSKQLSVAHSRFLAIKLLEDDPHLRDFQTTDTLKCRKLIEESYQSDIETIIARERYHFIEEVKKKVLVEGTKKESLTDRLDKIFVNKWLSLPIFFVIMFLVYYLAVGVIGELMADFIEDNFAAFGNLVSKGLVKLGASPWSVSLVVDGIIVGVGAVLAFIPQLIMLFLSISLLEGTGYMSRISFMLDKVFRKFGLSGKSLIPFIVGSGCSVPAVMSTRTIEDEQERKMSIVLTPFIPCSAKLPIIILFASFFFKGNSGLVAASLYFMAIGVIFLSAFILKKFIFKGEPSAYIEELPNYKAINIRHTLRDVWMKIWDFIKQAGTLILLGSILIWFLVSFSWKFEYGIDINKSILAWIGNSISWFFYPMLGELSWAASVSSIQGLIAKEQVVSSMSVIAGLSEVASDGGALFSASVFNFFSGPSAYAFMAFNLFSAPCVATIAAMRTELGSRKRAIYAVLFQTMLAWLISVGLYWLLTFIKVVF